MVGIPRSQGCHACRKRKKACSLETPECRICVKAGRKCPGYERERKFVHPSANRVPWKAAHREEDGRVSQGRKKDEDVSARNNNGEVVRSEDETSRELSMIVSPASTKSLLAQMEQMQLLGAFRSRYQAQTIQAPRDYWFVNAGRTTQMSNALHASMLAFGAAKIGRISNDMDLVRSGHRMYAKGLKELQKALWDPRLVRLDDTLGACVLLALFEANECPTESRSGFKSHHDGCAALVKARGPEAHADGLGRAIFSSFRMMGAFEGIANRKTFLSNPTWKDVPFRHVGKTELDRLVDLMLELPPLLAYTDEIAVMTDLEVVTAKCYELMDLMVELENRFAQFYRDLEGTKDSPCWPAVQSRDGFESDDDLFPFYFAFPDLHTASLTILCWAMQTVVLAIIALLHNHLAPTEGHTTSPLGTQIDARSVLYYSGASLDMARKVCQSVEFCLYTSPHTVGPPAVMAPLRCILDTLGPWPTFEKEKDWILRILNRVQKHGMAIVPYLHQIPLGYVE